MKPDQLALLHLYPNLAGLSEDDRRATMLRVAGAWSSRQLDQTGFELCMAAFERALWDGVAAGRVKDPRLCRKCGERLRMGRGGFGHCPAGCEERLVAAWQPDYWRARAEAGAGQAARLKHKVLELWELAQDYLDPEERTDAYLAGLIAQANAWPLGRVWRMGAIAWPAVTAGAAHNAIEALKARLQNVVPAAPELEEAPF